ncbi:MAG TPA: hypothetical protein VH518_19860 [Tepidisphaeraceae bacterium]|jgi:hypothetical protein
MDAAGARAYTCPHCQQIVEIAEIPEGGIVECPQCHNEFSIPDSPTELPSASTEELDGLRIRQLSALRRGAYRTRSYAIIAAGASGVLAVQLLWMAFRHVRALGWGLRPIGYLLFVPPAIWGAWYFLTRAVAAHREAHQTSLTAPAQPPDFSTLSDGSQHAKNLEDVR